MKVSGSCHCGKIQFEGTSKCTVPIFRCYCEQCRKCNGSPMSTYLNCEKSDINIVFGQEFLSSYEINTGTRKFCCICGSSIFFLDSRWPDNIFPLASCIDTPLGKSQSYVHIFVRDKAQWFDIRDSGPQFDEYPDETSYEWHKKLNLKLDE
ncbi:MAG: GFA family protein [Bdellovibrionales bacterium]|nr:GFA family protein [Bdellovibrionales bacterium]